MLNRTAGFVEQTALKLGLKAPSITLEQMSLRSTRIMTNLVCLLILHVQLVVYVVEN